MTGNQTYRLNNAALLHTVAVEAPEVVTTAMLEEMLAPALERHRMPSGKIEQLAGVRERRWWPKDGDFVAGAVEAGRRALAESGVDPSDIGLVVNASVTRPHLEPAIAARVHHELGLPPGCLAFDITNACLAVVNGIQLAGTMIDAGQIEYALIVASEGVRHGQEETIRRLVETDSKRSDMNEAFATLTLGCGAVGVLVSRADRHPEAHRIIGGVSRSGSEHHELCIGTMDGMVTDNKRLFTEGLALAVRTWQDAQNEFDWADGMDWYVAHQTSTAHIDGLCKKLGLDRAQFPLTLPTFGNMGPASLPFTLAKYGDT
ncbi:MAG: 3-oxoacyl-ACP synthase III, partial [Propionibacteriales bacterium]|nr:3-oxoacyl-ACP synthase III [Propionibacteriales bacterium]